MNSKFSFTLTNRHTKIKELSLPYYLPRAEGRIVWVIHFRTYLRYVEMQTVSSRVWTQVVVFVTKDVNHYRARRNFGAFFVCVYIYIYIYIFTKKAPNFFLFIFTENTTDTGCAITLLDRASFQQQNVIFQRKRRFVALLNVEKVIHVEEKTIRKKEEKKLRIEKKTMNTNKWKRK